MGKLIINSDDFGYSRGVNYGIIDSFNKGILTSTTLMANMPGFEHAVNLAKQNPSLGVGVHLTLTCGSPLRECLSTITENGRFKKLSFYQHHFEIDQNELYTEWNEQIKKVLSSGITPTHLDSHHHTHSFGRNQEVIRELAQKYDLPVRGNMKKLGGIKHVEYFEKDFDSVGEDDPQKRTIDVPLEEYLDELLKKIVSYEVTEIMCHTAYIDNELLNGSSFVFPRVKQVEFLINSSFTQAVLNDSRIQLANYSIL